jgi:two-component system chemotaxis response regulator CheY
MDDNVCRAGLAIVEDEKELVKVYLKLFERRGINVCFVAYDGEEAIRKYLESMPKPHILIMDYRLPTISGIDVAREVMKIDPDARIIFLSADASVKDEALKAGARTFLVKPASIREIDSAIALETKDIAGFK